MPSQLSAVDPVTVALSTTADTPLAGTPPRPATCSSIDWPLPTGPTADPGRPTPERVSRIRAGVSGVNSPRGSGVRSIRPTVSCAVVYHSVLPAPAVTACAFNPRSVTVPSGAMEPPLG